VCGHPRRSLSWGWLEQGTRARAGSADPVCGSEGLAPPLTSSAARASPDKALVSSSLGRGVGAARWGVLWLSSASVCVVTRRGIRLPGRAGGREGDVTVAAVLQGVEDLDAATGRGVPV